jgi:hypothetical protein
MAVAFFHSHHQMDTAKLTDAKVLGWRQAWTTQNECVKGIMIGNRIYKHVSTKKVM